MKLKTKKTKLQKAGDVFYGAVLALLLIIVGLIAINQYQDDDSFMLLSVHSGSMEPAIPTGSMIINSPSKVYSIGSVVTYEEAKRNVLVTHRIVDVKSDEWGMYYVAQGDANDAPDNQHIRPSQITGRVIFTVPWLGYAVQYARTEIGFILAVLLPTALIVFHELRVVKVEVLKLLTHAFEIHKKHTIDIIDM